METTICKNCETDYQGKFCPNCGQKAKTKRITFRQVMSDLRDQFWHFDKGFLFTIKSLVLRPGPALREYLEGKRVNHVKPMKFLFWAATISIIVSAWADLEGRIMRSVAEQQGRELPAASMELGHRLMEWINRYPGLVSLLTVPTMALCGWLFYRKKGYYYAEHFTVNIFLMAQLSLWNLLTTAILILIPSLSLTSITVLSSVQWIIWAIYYGWAYSGLHEDRRKILGRLKGIAVLIFGYMLLILLISTITTSLLYLFEDDLRQFFQQQQTK